MTHDELLEEINEAIADFDLKFDNNNPYYKALRAVVELHKPHPIKDSMIYCEGCSDYAFSPWGSCTTIEAIEKEFQ